MLLRIIWLSKNYYISSTLYCFSSSLLIIFFCYKTTNGLRHVSILFSSLIQSTLLSSELATTSSTLSPARSALYTKYYLYSNASTDAILLHNTYCEAPLACDWNTELHFGDANNPTQKNGNRSFWYKILWTTFWWSLTSGRSKKVEYHISEVKSYIIMFLNRSKMDTFYMYEIQSASSKQTK